MSDESPRDDRMSSDPETIREWAVDREVVPVETAGTGGMPGLNLVPASEGEAYEVLGWEEFADRLAESGLIVQREGDDLDVIHSEQVEQGTAGEPAETGGVGQPSVDEDPRTVEPDPGTDEPDPGTDEPGTAGMDEPAEPEMGAAEPGMDEPGMGSDEPGMGSDDPGMGPDDPVERERREHGTSPGGSVERGGSPLDEAHEGKRVVDDAGQEVGMVVAVEQEEGLMYVDPNPSFTQKIMAKIGWGDAGEGDYPVEAERIQEVTDDEVVLKPGSALGEADRG